MSQIKAVIKKEKKNLKRLQKYLNESEERAKSDLQSAIKHIDEYQIDYNNSIEEIKQKYIKLIKSENPTIAIKAIEDFKAECEKNSYSVTIRKMLEFYIRSAESEKENLKRIHDEKIKAEKKYESNLAKLKKIM